jgi:adenylate cyclase
VRKAGDRIRITAQLIEASTGVHLWADRFDGVLEDVFDLQDKVAVSVADVIEPTVQVAETLRSTRRPTTDLTAYDLYLRAFSMFHSSSSQIPQALALLDQAIERDAQYGPALAFAAACYTRLNIDGWSENPEADSRKAIAFARRALEGASNDPGVLVNAAAALAFFGEDIGTMMALVDRVLALNPSFARGWFTSGGLRLWAGQPEVAIGHAEISLRLSPRARLGWCSNLIGAAHFFCRRFDQAVPNFLIAIQEDPSRPGNYRFLAGLLRLSGTYRRGTGDRGAAAGYDPIVIHDATFLRNAEYRELFLSGLRLAAGETT